MMLEKLRRSDTVREKELGDGISSFNFTRDAFFRGDWNESSTIARGLFVDTETGEVVARSYPKFFNFNEGKYNTLPWLEDNLQFPVFGYEKYNGFLGILSWDSKHGKLFFASKSTTESDFAGWFKSIFNSTCDIAKAESYLRANSKSLVFEVIDPTNDPHIIEYSEGRCVLLDAIDNSFEYGKLEYGELCALGVELGLEVKRMVTTVPDFATLSSLLENGFSEGGFIEGLVLEDSAGYMFKFKFDYYCKWKRRRSLKERVQNGRDVSAQALCEEDRKFLSFICDYYSPNVLAEKSLIDIRNDYDIYGEL